MRTQFPFLWLCGPMGIGKSSVGWEIFTQLKNADIKTGYADADQLGLCYPLPEDDPVNHRVKSLNLGAVYRNFRDAGARCFIFSGSVSSEEQVRTYKNQIPGASLSICMLRANTTVIKDRFLQRGWKPHLVDDAIREIAELERAKFADIRVDTDNHSIKEVARMVRAQADNWPGLT
jgi:adenylylsulfate kinase-like enzyme